MTTRTVAVGVLVAVAKIPTPLRVAFALMVLAMLAAVKAAVALLVPGLTASDEPVKLLPVKVIVGVPALTVPT
jgi:hypothetical protein